MPFQQLTGHRDAVLCIQAEGLTVYSGSADGTIKNLERIFEEDCRLHSRNIEEPSPVY